MAWAGRELTALNWRHPNDQFVMLHSGGRFSGDVCHVHVVGSVGQFSPDPLSIALLEAVLPMVGVSLAQVTANAKAHGVVNGIGALIKVKIRTCNAVYAGLEVLRSCRWR